MEIQSYDDLMMLIREERRNATKINNRLDELSINPFSKDRFERRRLKSKLNDIQDRLSSYKKIIDRATTFKRYKLLNFFCEYLTLTEQENFVVTKFTEVEENDDYSLGLSYVAAGTSLKNPGLTTLGIMNMVDSENEETDYYVVSNEEVARALQCTFDNDVDEAIKEVDNARCFYVTDKIIHLARGTLLKRKYQQFPQLNSVFERLIDLSLSNPDFTDEERFRIIINETKGYKFINKY